MNEKKACEDSPPTPAPPPIPTPQPTPAPPVVPTPAPPPMPIRSAILEHVYKSPQKAGEHDKAGWIALYAPDAVVEDPVGTGPMVGHENIGRFYNAFIAQNDINFTQVYMPDIVTRSAQCTTTECKAAVSRWVEISTTLSTGITVKVEAILVYEVVGSPTGLQIKALNTYWPLAAQMNQVLAYGLVGFQTGIQLSLDLLQHLGVQGSLRYAQGFESVGDAGDAAMQQVVDAVNSGDRAAFDSVLSLATFQMPYGFSVIRAQAWATLSACQCTIGTMQTASDFTAATLQCAGGGFRVLRLTFDGSKKAVALDGFWNDSGAGGDGCQR